MMVNVDVSAVLVSRSEWRALRPAQRRWPVKDDPYKALKCQTRAIGYNPGSTTHVAGKDGTDVLCCTGERGSSSLG